MVRATINSTLSPKRVTSYKGGGGGGNTKYYKQRMIKMTKAIGGQVGTGLAIGSRVSAEVFWAMWELHRELQEETVLFWEDEMTEERCDSLIDEVLR